MGKWSFPVILGFRLQAGAARSCVLAALPCWDGQHRTCSFHFENSTCNSTLASISTHWHCHKSISILFSPTLFLTFKCISPTYFTRSEGKLFKMYCQNLPKVTPNSWCTRLVLAHFYSWPLSFDIHRTNNRWINCRSSPVYWTHCWEEQEQLCLQKNDKNWS